MADLDKIAREWLMARDFIVQWARDVAWLSWGQQSQASLEHNAAALLARLAAHDPPLLLCSKADLDAQHEREQRLLAALDQALSAMESARSKFPRCGGEWMAEIRAAIAAARPALDAAGGETR